MTLKYSVSLYFHVEYESLHEWILYEYTFRRSVLEVMIYAIIMVILIISQINIQVHHDGSTVMVFRFARLSSEIVVDKSIAYWILLVVLYILVSLIHEIIHYVSIKIFKIKYIFIFRPFITGFRLVEFTFLGGFTSALLPQLITIVLFILYWVVILPSVRFLLLVLLVFHLLSSVVDFGSSIFCLIRAFKLRTIKIIFKEVIRKGVTLFSI